MFVRQGLTLQEDLRLSSLSLEPGIRRSCGAIYHRKVVIRMTGRKRGVLRLKDTGRIMMERLVERMQLRLLIVLFV